MRLYGITVEDVKGVFRDALSVPATEGTRRVLVGKPAAKFAQRSLKVVYIEEQGDSVVLSVYPLKRAYRGFK
jgi:uncharacterized protein YbjT (DUF2867 family)